MYIVRRTEEHEQPYKKWFLPVKTQLFWLCEWCEQPQAWPERKAAKWCSVSCKNASYYYTVKKNSSPGEKPKGEGAVSGSLMNVLQEIMGEKEEEEKEEEEEVDS